MNQRVRTGEDVMSTVSNRMVDLFCPGSFGVPMTG